MRGPLLWCAAGLVLCPGVFVAAWFLFGGSPPPPFTLRGAVVLSGRVSTGVGKDPGACAGSSRAGYGDLAAGADVTVYDATGRVVGSGLLGAGRFEKGPQHAQSPCRLTFSVADVPGGPSSYAIQLSQRDRVAVPAADARFANVIVRLG